MRGIAGDRLVDQTVRQRVVDAVDREHRVDRDVVEQRAGDVRRMRDRLPQALLVRRVAPRAALAEHGRVEVPRAQAALAPHEVIAHARAPADRALHERLGRVRHRVEDVFRQIVRVDDGVFGERVGDGRGPSDPREQLEIAQRRDERPLVRGIERLVGPRRRRCPRRRRRAASSRRGRRRSASTRRARATR